MPRKIVLLAHNIRSLWNVGSFFRTADAFGVQKMYLTGYTSAPPRLEISKTALGAETWVPWEKVSDPLPLIHTLKSEGFLIASLELSEVSIALPKFNDNRPICLVLGHEVSGVPRELLNCSDVTLQIPMLGKKHSLNVSVAAGIGLYHLSLICS